MKSTETRGVAICVEVGVEVGNGLGGVEVPVDVL